MIEKVKRVAMDLDEVTSRMNELGKRQQILVESFNKLSHGLLPSTAPQESNAEISEASV